MPAPPPLRTDDTPVRPPKPGVRKPVGPTRRPPEPGRWSWDKWLLLGVALIAFVATLIVVSARYTAKERLRQPEISYTRYIDLLRTEQIQAAVVSQAADGSYLLTGHLKRQQAVATDEDSDSAAVAPTQTRARPITRFTVKLPAFTELTANELAARGVRFQLETRGHDWFGMLFGLLPYAILFLVMYLFVFRKLGAGAKGATLFGRGRAKPIEETGVRVTFADVAGAEEAKEELMEVVEFLREPARFEKLGGKIPRGVLLTGPPGTGKTLLARAVAGEAGVPFFSMSGADFVEMFVGVGAARVRDLFEQGRKHAPCILFIDEIDAVGRHRGAGTGGGNDEREQTLNQLLVEMDGFSANEHVILIAATNRSDVLDKALLRPGRFDRHVIVDLPDVRGREGILRVHTRDLPLDPTVDLHRIARATPGFAGAELANLVNEAAIFAARRGGETVGAADFELARDKVLMGPERRSLILSESEKRLTAYHEAGHAVISIALPGLDPLHKITIVPRGRSLGATYSLPSEELHNETRQKMTNRLAMSFGGRAAEALIFGPEHVTTGASGDITQATALARAMVTRYGMSDAVGPILIGADSGGADPSGALASDDLARLVDGEIKRLIDGGLACATSVLETRMDLLHALAGALLDRETLDQTDIERLVAGQPLPMLPPVVDPLAAEPTPAATAP